MTVATFEGYVIARSSKAVMFQSVYWDGGIWFPNSQITLEEDGDISLILCVNDWLTKKRDILEFTHYGSKEIEDIAKT